MTDPVMWLRERMHEYQRLERVFSPDGPLYARWYGNLPLEEHPLERTYRPDTDLEGLAERYRAQGVAFQSRGPVLQADHLSVELEFMAYLVAAEMKETVRGDAQGAAAKRKTQAEFFQAHLGAWAPAFALAFWQRFPEGCAARLAAKLERVMEDERMLLVGPVPVSKS